MDSSSFSQHFQAVGIHHGTFYLWTHLEQVSKWRGNHSVVEALKQSPNPNIFQTSSKSGHHTNNTFIRHSYIIEHIHIHNNTFITTHHSQSVFQEIALTRNHQNNKFRFSTKKAACCWSSMRFNLETSCFEHIPSCSRCFHIEHMDEQVMNMVDKSKILWTIEHGC